MNKLTSRHKDILIGCLFIVASLPFFIIGKTHESFDIGFMCLFGALFFLVFTRKKKSSYENNEKIKYVEGFPRKNLTGKYSSKFNINKLEIFEHGISLFSKNHGIVYLEKNEIKKITLEVKYEDYGYRYPFVYKDIASIFIETCFSDNKEIITSNWGLRKEIPSIFDHLRHNFENDFEISSTDTIFYHFQKHKRRSEKNRNTFIYFIVLVLIIILIPVINNFMRSLTN